MPKQINTDQTAKLYNIMGGNIPLAAVRQDIRGWEGFERRVLTRAAEMSVQDWQKDYRKKLADDYMARAQGYTARQSALVEQDRTAQLESREAERKQREARIDREAMASHVFFRALEDKDWETAKSMTDSFEALKPIFKERMYKELSDLGLGWLVNAIKAEGRSTDLTIQCVALMADILNNYMGEDIVTKGSTGHGSVMLSRIASNKYKNKLKDVTQDVINSGYKNLKFGDLIQLPGSHFGHVMMFVGYTADGAPVLVEATGELQHSDVSRWKKYSDEAYETVGTSKGLKPHLQIYDENGNNDYFGKNTGRTPTKILRMQDKTKVPQTAAQIQEAMRLMSLVMPYGNESSGGAYKGSIVWAEPNMDKTTTDLFKSGLEYLSNKSIFKGIFGR